MRVANTMGLLVIGVCFSASPVNSKYLNYKQFSKQSDTLSAVSPQCDYTSGTYKNTNGDIATVASELQGAVNETRVNIHLKQQAYRKSLTFTYFTPNGYGIRTTGGRGARSIYYVSIGEWRVAIFGEGSPLWYSEPRTSVPDSAWFQVLCTPDIEAAKRLSLPAEF